MIKVSLFLFKSYGVKSNIHNFTFVFYSILLHKNTVFIKLSDLSVNLQPK